MLWAKMSRVKGKILRNKDFACGSSQLLCLVPILLMFFTEVAIPLLTARPDLLGKVHCIIACLEVVEVLQLVKIRDFVTPEVLYEVVMKHLKLFQANYDLKDWRPKHHCAWHLPDMLRRFAVLIACFTHERKHRTIRRYAFNRKNTLSTELGMMEDLCIDQLLALRDISFSRGILGKCTPRPFTLGALQELFPQCTEFYVNQVAKIHSNIHVGDIAYFEKDGLQCGEVLLHFWADDDQFTILSEYELVANEYYKSTYKLADNVCCIHTMSLFVSLTYMTAGEHVIVLVPPDYR